jgi:ATP-dependent helicase HrpA
VFGTIPRVVGGSGDTARGYPALVDEGESVGLRIFATRIEQLRSMSAASRRLVQLVVPPPARAFRDAFGDGLSLTEMPHASMGALFQDSWDCAVGRLIADHGGLAWDDAAFAELAGAVRRELPSTMEGLADELDGIFSGAGGVRRALDELTGPALAKTATDVRSQLDRLVYPGFVTATGTERLVDLPRYLDAMVVRLERARADVGRDLRLLEPVAALEAEFRELAESREGRVAAAEMQRLRWDLEELRVSVFAQTIGTRGTVSEPRIRSAMATISESAQIR